MAERFKCSRRERVARGETDKEAIADIASHDREQHDMEMTEGMRQKVLSSIEED